MTAAPPGYPALNEIEARLEKYRPGGDGCEGPVIGYFCSYAPLEIIETAGLQPYRIIPSPGRAITRADSYIDRNFCPYVRTLLGEALDGHYDFLSGLIIVNSCDAMRRLHDVWRYNVSGGFIHLLDIPRVDTEAAVAYYRECLDRLAGELEKRYGTAISEEALSAAIARRNRLRHLLRQLYRLNAARGLPLRAVQVQKVVRAGLTLPAGIFSSLLQRLLDELDGRTAATVTGPKVVITGSILDNPRILELVEDCGARVVADDLCTGTRYFWSDVAHGDDSLTRLSRHYLGRVTCPRMKESQRRLEHLLGLVDEFGAGGVIAYNLKFCDPFLYDLPCLKEQLAGRGIPVLVLEGDYTPGTLGRVKTRIEAFIEMLGQYARTA